MLTFYMCTNYARTLPRLQPCVHDIIDIVHVQCNSDMHFIWIAGIMKYRPVAPRTGCLDIARCAAGLCGSVHSESFRHDPIRAP